MVELQLITWNRCSTFSSCYVRLVQNFSHRATSGMLTEACISSAVLSAQEAGFDSYVVGDACGGFTAIGHDLALRRMQDSGASMTSWLQVVLELQRDWTRKATYDAARAIIERNGGGYGIGLNYARDMLPHGTSYGGAYGSRSARVSRSPKAPPPGTSPAPQA